MPTEAEAAKQKEEEGEKKAAAGEKPSNDDSADGGKTPPAGRREDDDDDDDENTVSLAVMEQTLLPDVLKQFQSVEQTYAKLHRAQDKRLTAIKKGDR